VSERQRVKKVRSAWVWVLAVLFSLSSIWTFISLLLVEAGLIAVPPEQRAYMHNLTVVDYGATMIISLANLAGAVSLFLMLRAAIYFFAAGFATNLLLTLWHVMTKGWDQTVGEPGFAGTLVGWCVLLAVCVYAWRLSQKKVLT
jgi:hypothetical protein